MLHHGLSGACMGAHGEGRDERQYGEKSRESFGRFGCSGKRCTLGQVEHRSGVVAVGLDISQSPSASGQCGAAVELLLACSID